MFSVMAGLDPAIHVLCLRPACQDVDARHKAGHDGVERQPGGATVASAWPERLSASATKPLFFISSMKPRR